MQMTSYFLERFCSLMKENNKIKISIFFFFTLRLDCWCHFMYSRVLGFSFSAGEMRPTIRLREGTVPPPPRILPMAAGTDPLPLQLRLQQTHLQILKDYAGQRSWKTVTSNWDTYDNLSGDISHISFPPRPPYLIPVGEHVCKRQSGFSLVYFGWCSFFFFLGKSLQSCRCQNSAVLPTLVWFLVLAPCEGGCGLLGGRPFV